MSQLTIAASAPAFKKLFDLVRDHFSFADADSADFGPFSASYDIALHLDDGALTLHNDGTIEVTDLDVVWDTLTLEVCLDLPCFGGFCIVPDPWNGCLVSFPRICLGRICVPLDLSGLVSEISELRARLLPSYFVDPARTPTESDLDAELAGHPNRWRVFVDPVFVHVDPIDLPASVAGLFEHAAEQTIDDLVPGGLPFFGPVIAVLVAALEITEALDDWLSDLLGTQFDFIGLIETAVADHFAAGTPILEFEDPYPILPGSGGLIPVKIPIRNLTATITSHEMVVEADVGA
jgi:hypothetical protein